MPRMDADMPGGISADRAAQVRQPRFRLGIDVTNHGREKMSSASSSLNRAS